MFVIRKSKIIFLILFLSFLLMSCGSFERRIFTNGSASGQLDEEWNDFNVEIFFLCHSESSFFWPTLTRKEVCKEPYNLGLEMYGDKDSVYSYLLINSAEIEYSSGEKIVLRKENDAPLKVVFENYSREKSLSYRFKKNITKKHQNNQRIKVKVVLTLMPSGETRVFSDTFYGITRTHKLGVFEMLRGV